MSSFPLLCFFDWMLTLLGLVTPQCTATIELHHDVENPIPIFNSSKKRSWCSFLLLRLFNISFCSRVWRGPRICNRRHGGGFGRCKFRFVGRCVVGQLKSAFGNARDLGQAVLLLRILWRLCWCRIDARMLSENVMCPIPISCFCGDSG